MARAPRKTKIDKDREALVVAVTADLSEFLADNQHVKIVDTGKSVRIDNLWGDNSLGFEVPSEFTGLTATLKAIRFPSRLSAIWHKESSDLEIIWTAYTLSKTQEEIAGRKFEYTYKNKKLICEFGESSEHLKTLAFNFIPLLNSVTSFRNILDFSQYMTIPEDRRKVFGLDKPRSFWIRGIKWNEDYILEVVNNLNFYLTYYDQLSPQIITHDPPEQNEKISQKTRYIAGTFPKTIDSQNLDTNLLSFWNSAERGDPMMRFLLYYRIIEYATTHYIDNAVRSEIRKVILSPHLKSNMTASLEKIASAVTMNKMDATQRFNALVRSCVDPKLIWRDVAANQAFFSKDTVFDGGFTAKALVSATDKEANFCTRGLDAFSDSVRKIRNALSHGKDQETAGVITPTTRNLKLFQPWIHLIATAAGEVVLFKDAT